MLLITAITAALLFVVLTVQSIWSIRFQNLFHERPKGSPSTFGPRVKVLLPVRGADPFLPDCVRALLSQEYSNYELQIVVDHLHDPALDVIEDVLDELQPLIPVNLEVLEHPRSTCSLKMSVLLQCVERMDDSIEVLVTVDADAIVYPNWLSDLVAPLGNEAVAVTTGIRWYHPERRDTGTMVRYQWNILAAVQMHAFNVPWGGSLAMRRAIFASARIQGVWANSMCEDTPLANEIRRLGYEMRVVPQAVIVNREEISLHGAFQFITRQLTFTRLHLDRRWWLIGHALSGFLLTTGLEVCVILSLIRGESAAANLGMISLIAAMLLALKTIKSTSRLPRMVLQHRGEEVPIPPLRLGTIMCFNLTHTVNFLAAVVSIFTRHVTWRAIRYRVSPHAVRMLHYQPYQFTQQTVMSRDGASI